MKLVIRKRTADKQVNRMKKKVRIRRKVNGTAERPRLCVYKSASHIYAQVIDDLAGKTLVAASSIKNISKLSGKDHAKAVGAAVAKAALAKNIKDVVFDRNGFIYHGRIQALADGAREAGLNF